jgi:D-tyrosyl-tRNA(Tyr) deacylase
MRLVIQRTLNASVNIAGKVHASIPFGLVILAGICTGDDQEDVKWLARKVAGMRIFNDDGGVMNLDIQQAGGSILLISQFTLHASTRKGNRPSYIAAARPEQAVPLYELLIHELSTLTGGKIANGIFGAHMQVSLVNDGPVTIILDSKSRE